jgi:NAD(P)-dependent dehydrogenase (short-subunit alcohol dehydrogenase family)
MKLFSERRIAVVTGGGAGIGEATALQLAEEGCAVAVIDIDQAKARQVADKCRETASGSIALKADVSDEKQINAAMEQVRDAFGVIDILIANAGIEGPMQDIGSMSAAQWDHVMGVNVRGPFLTVKACLPAMRQRQQGTIVLTASNYGFIAAPQTVAYSTSKGAVAALARALAVELVRDGIRVNCVCPGNVDTTMFDRALAMQVEDPAAVKSGLGRLATPHEIASVIAFLASEKSSYMLGSQVVVDYGEMSRGGPVWPARNW